MIYNGTIELATESKTLTLNNVSGLGAEIFESIYGPSVYKLSFHTSDVNVWNSIIQDQGGINDDPKTKLKVRVVGLSGSGNEVKSDWKTFNIKKFVCQIEGNLAHVDIVGYDDAFILQHSCRRASYKQKTVSDIVKDIADANSMEVEVDEFSKAKYNLLQCGMSDYGFIQDVLIPRASKDSILFYVKDGNILVFKQRKREKASLKLSYQAEGNEESVFLNYFTAMFSVNTSNFYIDGVTFDRAKKQKESYLQEFTSDGLSGDPFIGAQPPLLYPLSFGKVANFVTDILETNINEALAMRTRPLVPFTMDRIAAPVYLLPESRPGVTANIDTKKVDERKLSFSGDYMVYAIYHRIYSEGDTGTTVFLERRGALGATGV